MNSLKRIWARWQDSTPGRIWQRQGELQLDLIAAGVAFYGLLALFPGIAALVSLFGLIADPAVVQAKAQTLSDVVPPEAWSIIDHQLASVTGGAYAALTFSVVTSLLLTLWSTTRGMRAMINSMNLIHGVTEGRNPIVQNLVAYGLTALTVALGVLAVLVIIGTPLIMRVVGLGSAGAWLAALLPWPILMLAAVGALIFIYRFAPARNKIPFGRVTKGAIGVAAAWIPASLIFTVFVGNFANFNATYGSLGAVVILLMWFFVSARIVLLGAVWNALPAMKRIERDRARQPEVADRRSAPDYSI